MSTPRKQYYTPRIETALSEGSLAINTWAACRLIYAALKVAPESDLLVMGLVLERSPYRIERQGRAPRDKQMRVVRKRDSV